MHKLLIILLFFTSFFYLNAQNFQKVYGGLGADRGHAIITTNSGGYAIAGHTSSFGAGGKDIFIMKLDASGNVLWQKTYGSSSNEDGNSIALAQTPDLGFVVTGITYGFGANSGDAYVFKVDQNGALLWDNKYSTASQAEHGRGITIASNGDVLIAGTDNGDGFGSGDFLFMRLDSNGNLLWSKIYGGGSNDHMHSIEELPGGNLIISGSTTSFSPGTTAGYIIKTDPSGNVIWDYTYGGNGADAYNASTMNDNYEIILTGPSNSYGAGNFDAFVTKIDTNGTEIWTKVYGGPAFERGASIQTIPNSTDYYLASNTESFGNGNKELLMMRIDDNGGIVWSKTYGTSTNEAFDQWSQYTLVSTTDGGFALTGWSDSLSGGGVGDEIIFLKSDGLGSVFCDDAVVSITTPNITRINPNTNVANTGVYVSVSSTVTPASFTEASINYCSNSLSPEAQFTTPTTVICENTCIDFTDLSTGSNINSYQWYFPGANQATSNVQNPTGICYPTAGLYMVSLVITDDNGSDSTSITNYIEVTTCAPPIADFTFTDTICVGDCIDFTDLSSSSPTSWSWDFSSGTPTNSTNQNPSGICFNTVGNFPITLTVSNINGSNAITYNIEVLNAPNAGLDTTTSLCVVDGDINLMNLLIGASSTSGEWTNTNTGQVSSSTFSPQTSGIGVYNYAYTLSNGQCTDVSNVLINVLDLNNAGSDTIIQYCINSSSFDLFPFIAGNPQNGGQWSPSLNSGTGVFTPQIDSEGEYMYIVTNSICPNDTATVETQLISLQTPTIVVPDTLCSTNSDVQLTADIPGGTWSGIGVIDNSAGLFSGNNLSDGTYTITYTIDSLNCIVSDDAAILIATPPSIDSISNFRWCYDRPLTIGVSTTGANTYLWSNGDTTSTTQYTFNEVDLNQIYNISIEVSNECGSEMNAFTISVIDCNIYLYVPNAFTPNGDEFNNLFGPSLNGAAVTDFRFEVYDRWGELIWESRDPKIMWDGTYAGRVCQDGVYTWVIEFATELQPRLKYTGHFNLLK